ncbi:MAG: hypothetical protein ABFC67_13135 [Mizugakiibacter sp.]|uniref:hypothetical protein n=1 Tax=Mizugakiibacter sp. TaxID=1972610 RepID=UPI0031C4BD9E|nr:hypothetical protein [Xanthomonadaceae bacterium]
MTRLRARRETALDAAAGRVMATGTSRHARRAVRTGAAGKAGATRGPARNAKRATRVAQRPARAAKKPASAAKRTTRVVKKPARAAERPARIAGRTPAAGPVAARVRSRTAVAAPAAPAPRVSAASRPRRPARRAERAAESARLAFHLDDEAAQFPCGDAAVRAATGHGWGEWLHLLEQAAFADRRPAHGEVRAAVLRQVPSLDGWWAQMVSVGYERARGLRAMHQTCSGEFQASASRTFAAPSFAAFAAWADETLRRGWLDAPGLEFTRLNPGRNIRARLPDGALIDIRFVDKGPARCQVVVDTNRLADAEAVVATKTFWRMQFARLAAFLGA